MAINYIIPISYSSVSYKIHIWYIRIHSKQLMPLRRPHRGPGIRHPRLRPEPWGPWGFPKWQQLGPRGVEKTLVFLLCINRY